MIRKVLYIHILLLMTCATVYAQSHTEQAVALMTGKREIRVIPEPSQDTIFTVPLSGAQNSVMVWVSGLVPLSVEIRNSAGQAIETGLLEMETVEEVSDYSIFPNIFGVYQWGTVLEVTGTTYIEVIVNRNGNAGTVGVVLATHADRDPLGAKLIATTDDRLGGVVGFSMFVFEDGVPCAGTAELLVQKPDSTAVTMNLYDDGVGVDPVANDGSFSGVYLVEVAGEHSAYAEYVGNTPSGLPGAKLSSGTSFYSEPGLKTLPSPPLMLDTLPWAVQFEYVDVNNNGKYEQIYLVYEATLFKDDEGFDYKLLTSITPMIEDQLYPAISLSSQKTCSMSSNQFRMLLPMGQLAVLGASGKLRVNAGSAQSLATTNQSLIYEGGEISEYINFEQLEHCPADVNQDWLVTPADFSAWISAYNAGDPLADINDDGQVSPADFSSWIGQYESGC